MVAWGGKLIPVLGTVGGSTEESRETKKNIDAYFAKELQQAALTSKSPCDHTHPFAGCSWISTEIGMPDDEQTVLIHVPGADDPVWFGFLDAGEWRYLDGGLCREHVTHWMQLPNPPEVQS
jgi:hypothetical protein